MAKHTDRLEAASAHKARLRNQRLARSFALVICVCVAFVAGFFVRGDAPLLESLGFGPVLEATGAPVGPASGKDKTTYNSLSARVSEVEDALANDSLDSYDLDAATDSVLDAFSDVTQDAYLRYYDPARYSSLVGDSSGSYAGIGVLFSEYNGLAYVVDVFDGSSAQAAGVRVGDFVVAVDGDRGQEWSMNEVTSALDRGEGESVVVTWRRPATLEAEGGEEFTTTLTCSTYDVKNVTTELDDKVGYIKLRQLTQNSSSLVKQAVGELASQGALSFVLDIRDNPGGFLTQAVDVASLFVKSGTIVQIETKDGKSAKSATGSVATDKPLVVLVNENTAAAAEVLAVALQESQRATLVGTSTLGKGSVQVVRDLSFGGALRYTAAYYLSPQGRQINGVGVAPNITIGLAGEAAGDSQKSLALETAQSLVQE
ncbi:MULTISPECIES: S41 family peptidase [Gordonibacter]|uniref:S41 family peptidase n=1 Tax=Gordonibacter faecis TaxID=3047475 RepID=A0ABT7DM02_9ACTN|nr:MULTISPECIES: S41 family peptidase [unclassified Gordonibacter]MDJ1649190.1 S41 family peptidase [Gordonibacter sp. KGMB12511]HIW76174.1 PDZ domain-containing protein [Candidatus Gordonibacter avicola]